MGWLERVKRNTWVDLYGEFDEKGNNILHVRILPEDLDRLIAIAEGAEWAKFDGIVYDKMGKKEYYCSFCSHYKEDGHADRPPYGPCLYHEDWTP